MKEMPWVPKRKPAMKPCPFCGSKNTFVSSGHLYEWGSVGCGDCDASIEYDNGREDNPVTLRKAVKKWNSRV